MSSQYAAIRYNVSPTDSPHLRSPPLAINTITPTYRSPPPTQTCICVSLASDNPTNGIGLVYVPGGGNNIMDK